MKAVALTYQSFDTIPLHSIAYLAANCHTNPGRLPWDAAPYHNKMNCMSFFLGMQQPKIIAPGPNPLSLGISKGVRQLFRGNTNSKSLATFGTSSLNHQSAVLGRHAHKKSMGSFSAYLTRLKGSFHEACS